MKRHPYLTPPPKLKPRKAQRRLLAWQWPHTSIAYKVKGGAQFMMPNTACVQQVRRVVNGRP